MTPQGEAAMLKGVEPSRYDRENCLAEIGEETIVEDGCTVGLRYRRDAGPAVIGSHGIIRMGTIIYGDVKAGDYLQTGHHAVIRAFVRLGDYCAVFHRVVIEGLCELGDGVRLMIGVYLPSRTKIGNQVFIGPGTVCLNDRYPARTDTIEPRGPVIEDEVVIGGGCTIGAGVTIGAGSFVAAGSLIIRDVPRGVLAMGSPATYRPLPDHLRRPNNRGLTMAPLDLWHPDAPLPDDASW
jgi:acetyltransferase-like isoleucine patch superfamily enzyme